MRSFIPSAGNLASFAVPLGVCLGALAPAPVAHGQGFATAHLVEQVPGDRPLATFAAYIDGDEHLDIVCAFVDSGSIVWYRNGGQGLPQFTRFTIETGLTQAVGVFAADIDGDGDTDIAAVGFGGTVRWYENNGGYTPAFTSRTIATGLNGPASLVAVDLDSDGDVDIVTSLANTNQVRWFDSDGGSPPTFTARTITTDPLFNLLSRVVSGDMDGDGDVDLVVKSDLNNLGLVLRNNGQTPPSFTFNVADGLSLPNACADIFVADIDRDGANDIVAISATDGEVMWFENDPPFPGGFRARTIANVGGPGRSVFAADLDGDGDVDIAAGWADIRQAIWFENNGQTPPQFTRHNIAVQDPLAEIEEIFVADLDGDGDPDIVTVGTDEVRWRESGLLGAVTLPEEPIRNATTDVVYPAPHMLPQAIDEAMGGDVLLVRGDIFAFPSDINLGDNSSLSLIALGNIPSQAPTVGYFLRNDSLEAVAADVVGFPRFLQLGAASVPIGREIWAREQGSITLQGLLSLQQSSLLAAATTIDMTWDASLVIGAAANARITAPGGTRILGEFGLPTGAFLDVTGPFTLAATPVFPDEPPVSTAVNFATSVAAGDINGDGRVDVLSTSQSDSAVYWHENDGADPPGFTMHTVSTTTDGARSVVPADLNGDGRLDVIAIAEFGDAILWFRNVEASPPQFDAQVLYADPGSGPQHIIAVDFDADGDLDVLSASALDDTIRWHENSGGLFPTFTARVVSTLPDYPVSVFAADLDGDGDLDVLSASDFDGSIRWYRRNGASPPAFTPLTISSAVMAPRAVSAADVDGDGRLDVLAVGVDDTSLRWFRNNGGSPPTFTEQVVPGPVLAIPASVAGVDADGDGDTDILVSSFDSVRWYENNGGSPPVFSPRDVTTLPASLRGLAAADVDGDGHADVLTSSYSDATIRLYRAVPTASTALGAGSLLSVTGDARLARPVTLTSGVIVARDGLLNTSTITGAGTFAADTINDGRIVLEGGLQNTGDYTNNATTTIRSGTFSVLGTLTNNGVIIGDLGRSVDGGLFTRGGLHAPAGAMISFPLGGTVSTGGDFDVAINRNTGFDMAAATLKMNALPAAGPQRLEVMSVDIGPDELGLDRTISGHYPLGTLRIGPTATTVELADDHDNAGDGQASCEAIYTGELIIEAGAILNTGTCRVYYQTIVMNGSVDNPANLIAIEEPPPPCPGDFNGDGVRDTADFFEFFAGFFGSPPSADYNGDGATNTSDFFEFFADFFGPPC